MSRELLFSVTKKDFRIDTFRSGGKGGQNQNKRDTGVRIVHRESGAVGESRSARTQGQNRKLAFEHLLASKKWKTWHRIKTAQMLGVVSEVNDRVDRALDPKNIRVDVRKGGRWVEAPGGIEPPHDG